MGRQLVRWLSEDNKVAFFAKCTVCWVRKGYFGEVVIAVVCFCKAEGVQRKDFVQLGEVRREGVVQLCWVSFWFFLSCSACVTSHTVSLLRWQFHVFSLFFFSEGIWFFSPLLKAQIRKCLCLTAAPSNSADAFAVSYCRDWRLHWKELRQCHFTASAALIS